MEKVKHLVAIVDIFTIQIVKQKILEYRFKSMGDTIAFLINEYVNMSTNNTACKPSLKIFSLMTSTVKYSELKNAIQCDFRYVCASYADNLDKIAKTNGYNSRGELIRCIVIAFARSDKKTLHRLSICIGRYIISERGIPTRFTRDRCVHLPVFINDVNYNTIQDMARKARCTVHKLFLSCIDVVLGIEYEQSYGVNDLLIINGVKQVLSTPGVVKNYMNKDKNISIALYDLEKYAKLLCVLEKYGIRSIVDFMARIIQFLTAQTNDRASGYEYDDFTYGDKVDKIDFYCSVYR